ncbi:MAG: hypothetical protein ACYTKC_08705 [Planctomycetota bacterium]|jgi:hypothetical protein
MLLPLCIALVMPSCGGQPELQGRYELDGSDFARTITNILDLEGRIPTGRRRQVWQLLKQKAVYELELYADGTFHAAQDLCVVGRLNNLQQLLESRREGKAGGKGEDSARKQSTDEGKDPGAHSASRPGKSTSLHGLLYGTGSEAHAGQRLGLRGWWRNHGLGQIELERTHVGDKADMDFVTASHMAGTLTLPFELDGGTITLRLNRRGAASPGR